MGVLIKLGLLKRVLSDLISFIRFKIIDLSGKMRSVKMSLKSNKEKAKIWKLQ